MQSRNITFKSFIGENTPVSVRAIYTPAYAGCWYRSNGDPGDPPEPAEAEIVEVAASSVIPLDDIHADDMERITNEAIERGHEYVQD